MSPADLLRDVPQMFPVGSRVFPPVLCVCRFYLVSDGIPLLIVCVTAAFGVDNYGSKDDAL